MNSIVSPDEILMTNFDRFIESIHVNCEQFLSCVVKHKIELDSKIMLPILCNYILFVSGCSIALYYIDKETLNYDFNHHVSEIDKLITSYCDVIVFIDDISLLSNNEFINSLINFGIYFFVLEHKNRFKLFTIKDNFNSSHDVYEIIKLKNNNEVSMFLSHFIREVFIRRTLAFSGELIKDFAYISGLKDIESNDFIINKILNQMTFNDKDFWKTCIHIINDIYSVNFNMKNKDMFLNPRIKILREKYLKERFF